MFTDVDHVIVNTLSDRWSDVDEYGNYHVHVGWSEAEKLFRKAGISDRIPEVGYERQLTPNLVSYNTDDNVILITLVNVEKKTSEHSSRKKGRSSKKRKTEREKEFEFAGYKFTSGPKGTVIKRKYI